VAAVLRERVRAPARARHDERSPARIREDRPVARRNRVPERGGGGPPLLLPLDGVARPPLALAIGALDRAPDVVENGRHTAEMAGGGGRARAFGGERVLDGAAAAACLAKNSVEPPVPAPGEMVLRGGSAGSAADEIQEQAGPASGRPRLDRLDRHGEKRFAAGLPSPEETGDDLSQHVPAFRGAAERMELPPLEVPAEAHDRERGWRIGESLFDPLVPRFEQHLDEILPLGLAGRRIAAENLPRAGRCSVRAVGRAAAKAEDGPRHENRFGGWFRRRAGGSGDLRLERLAVRFGAPRLRIERQLQANRGRDSKRFPRESADRLFGQPRKPPLFLRRQRVPPAWILPLPEENLPNAIPYNLSVEFPRNRPVTRGGSMRVSRIFKFFCLFALGAASTLSAQTVDEIVAKNVQARGGMDKLKAIHSLEFAVKMNQQGLEFPGKMDMKRPDKIRMDMTIQGKTLVQAYDGKTAWMIMPFMGSTDPQPMSADEAKEVIEQADFDGPMVDYKSKGNTVELIGQDDVEGSPAYKLKVTLKNGDISYIYIDTDTGLEVKETAKRKQQGSEVEVDSFLSNYQPVDGVLFPYSVENKVQGKTMGHFTIDSVKTNVPIDDAVFAMPAPAPKAPAGDKK